MSYWSQNALRNPSLTGFLPAGTSKDGHSEVKEMTSFGRFGRIALVLTAGVVITLASACEQSQVVGEYPNRRQGDSTPYDYQKPTDPRAGSIFGEGGLFVGVGGDKQQQNDNGGGLGVNGYLWRASLDTISFMPVNSADPFGGVIVTDWYAMPETPDERFKMNVYILGRALRADGVRVAVFRQVRADGGSWADAPVADEAGIKIENAILTRARQLRFDTLQQQ